MADVRIRSLVRVMTLFAALRRRQDRAERGKPRQLLDAGTLALIGKLLSFRGRVPPDFEAEIHRVVGYTYWARANRLPEEQAAKERRLAEQFLAVVYRDAPQTLPEHVRDHYADRERSARSALRLIPPEVLSGWTAFRRYQDLDPAEFRAWTPGDDRPMICVSHRWISPSHPDPDGVQMQELHQRLRTLIAADPELATAGVFLDYASMPQSPRSPAEEADFGLDMGRLADLFGAARKVIILSEGYHDYRDRAWCFFEVMAAYTSLDYGDPPRVNLHLFPDQRAIAAELEFLSTTMFQTMFGRTVTITTSYSTRYKPWRPEVEVLSAAFQHLHRCSTTDPDDKPALRRQLAGSMSARPNVSPYGRLVIALNRYFEVTFCYLAMDTTVFEAVPHFEAPELPRVPSTEANNPAGPLSPFSMPQEQIDALIAKGGVLAPALRISHPDVPDMAAYIGGFQQRRNWEGYLVHSYDAMRPSRDTFPTIDHVVHTILEIGAPLIGLGEDKQVMYFLIADPAS